MLRSARFRMPENMLTVLLCAAALPLTLALPGAHSDPAPLFFLAAIAVSAWRGGFRSAALAFALACLEMVYLVFPPVSTLSGTPMLITHFGATILLMAVTGVVVARVRTAAHRADIKQQQWAQEAELQRQALMESEARFRSVFNNSPDAILITLPDGAITAANPAACALFRMKEEELCQLFRADVVAADDPRSRPVLEGSFSLRRSTTEMSCVRKDGTRFEAEIGSLILEGEPSRAFFVVRDVTERKRAEQALRESEQRFRSLVEQASDGFFVNDDEGRFIDVNRQACESLGYERDELLRMRVGDVEQDFDLAIAKTVWHQMEPGEALTIRGHQRRRDGSVFPVEVRLSTCDLAGQRLYLGLIRDITAQKQAEQALLQSEKLASVGRMAAAIAHEINNPLAAVTNLLFLAGTSEGIPLSARRYLETAEEEMKRVTHIARQSLGFYRESNASAPTSINRVLDSAVDLLSGKIRAKSAVVEKQCEKTADVVAIAGELRQVFSNLLANSLDAIEDGGTIKLRVSADAAGINGNRWVRITVADDGKGISASARQHIFEPLFTTKGTVGTGLGLWVSKQIIDKHGGAIRVRSNDANGPHRGTTVSILLPAQSAVISQAAGN